MVLLNQLRDNPENPVLKAQFDKVKDDLGFGLLLLKYTQDVGSATPEMINKAVDDTIPRVLPMFFAFRIMVGMGVLMLALFAVSLWSSVKGNFMQKPWLLRWAMYMLPVPWIAVETGWFVAEYGRQPWTVYGMLPTGLSVSNISVTNVYLSFAGFVLFYTVLFVIEVYLMVKYVRKGPASLGTGRYEGEDDSTHITHKPTGGGSGGSGGGRGTQDKDGKTVSDPQGGFGGTVPAYARQEVKHVI